MTKEKRAELFEAATKAAKAVGYVNAGTVEFLMDRDKNFYFMEMNTRLQVEHPVSELVTGKDIVKWQIRIAAGVELDCTQADIKVRGAAIECRINAGGVGKVNFLHIPSGPWVRFDTFLYQGYEVPPFYDSMLGKMIVFSSTREEAIRKICLLYTSPTPFSTAEIIIRTSSKTVRAEEVHLPKGVDRYEFDGSVPLAPE